MIGVCTACSLAVAAAQTLSAVVIQVAATLLEHSNGCNDFTCRLRDGKLAQQGNDSREKALEEVHDCLFDDICHVIKSH